LYSKNCEKKRKSGYGICAYVKDGDQANVFFEFNSETLSVNFVGISWNDCAICVCYKSPCTSFVKVSTEFKKMLQKAFEISSNKVIVIGDLNIDLASKPNDNLFKILREKELSYRLPAGLYSTNGNTQIDIAFANLDMIDFCFYESYFSYHRPIICTFEDNSRPISRKNESAHSATLNNDNNIEVSPVIIAPSSCCVSLRVSGESENTVVIQSRKYQVVGFENLSENSHEILLPVVFWCLVMQIVFVKFFLILVCIGILKMPF